jgi:hypothetical protein
MAIPAVPGNFFVQMANAQILLTWNVVPGATGYSVQRSTDQVNYTTVATPTAPQFLDTQVITGTQYWYQVAATNGSGTSNYNQLQANDLPATEIPSISGQMSLYKIRLLAQQAADRVNSQFVSTPEWNSFINLAGDELYDLITTVYEDYQMYQPVYFTTGAGPARTSVTQGVTYNITSLGTTTNAQWNALGAPGTVTQGMAFVSQVSQAIPGSGTVQIAVNGSSQNYPMPDGISTFQDAAGNTFTPPPIYKLSGIDLGLNNAPNGFVTVSKYNFIDSTIYGVFGLQYRFLGNTIRFIPMPSSQQPIGIWYIPRRVQLLQDTDISEGYNGWIRYVIVRAAKYALDKEESDTSKLDSELLFLKKRIEDSAPNRDEGQADTISDARSAQGYGPDGSSGGGWGGPQGYGW